MKILIVGGAGYIGSHMVNWLLRDRYDVVVYDDLSSGHRDAVGESIFVEGSLLDVEKLQVLFATHQFDAVMHFSAKIEVGESVKLPDVYYTNNVVGTINLLHVMLQHDVKRFIFSSTAAVYGQPEHVPIQENHPKNPCNPYGKSKWMIEQMLEDYDRAYGLRSISLRYFNAAGAHPEGILAERHDPETHLIPLVLQAAAGKREAITVFGNDYPTHDGTCIRDYVHVMDLCQAHALALEALSSRASSCVYNLGNGEGFSVNEVIAVARSVTHCDIPVIYGERREGDPSVLLADASKIKSELAWKPRYSELSVIVGHAWQSLLSVNRMNSDSVPTSNSSKETTIVKED